MIRVALLAGFALILIPYALAQTTDDKPTKVTIQTPDDWSHATLSDGIDRYEPPQGATPDRPGNANCLVMTVTDPQTRTLGQDQVDASLAQTAPKFLSGLSGSTTSTSVDIQTLSEQAITIPGHNAYLIVAKSNVNQGNLSIKARQASVFLAAPGWEYVATCVTGAQTEDEAAASWDAWKDTLLEIVQSIRVES